MLIGTLALIGVSVHFGLLLEGRDPSPRLCRRGHHDLWLAGLARRVPDGAVHVPADLRRVLRTGALAPARQCVGAARGSRLQPPHSARGARACSRWSAGSFTRRWPQCCPHPPPSTKARDVDRARPAVRIARRHRAGVAAVPAAAADPGRARRRTPRPRGSAHCGAARGASTGSTTACSCAPSYGCLASAATIRSTAR